eukprot:TRINITY_DN42170_c0_g1_i1.p1 TRINITY_DN42170_c0_g1~~TRINITY_DN42170_c0_g1_i1.p1  ORF type:complete len:367 (+),score=58.22 TRINITY_DN42170_c0_g1_i1:34-1134(+)
MATSGRARTGASSLRNHERSCARPALLVSGLALIISLWDHTSAFATAAVQKLGWRAVSSHVQRGRAVDLLRSSAIDPEDYVDDFYNEDNSKLMEMLMGGERGDEVDILGNGSLIKHIVKPAPAFSRRPQLGDEVTVHFRGSLEDGTVFDDTWLRHEPYKTRIGVGFVIGGWEKGIPTMMKGERAVFTMHPSVAYGEQGAGWKIPPNASVRFEIELLGWEELDDMGPDDIEPEWEAPLVGRDDVGPGGREANGLYSWERNGLEVLVKAQVPDDTRTKDIVAEFYPQRVFVAVRGQTILSGTPGCNLEWEECYWDLHKEEEIENDPQARLWLWVHLQKKDAEKVRWPLHLFKEEVDDEGDANAERGTL